MGTIKEQITSWFWGIILTTQITTHTTWFIKHGVDLSDWETIIRLFVTVSVGFFTSRYYYFSSKKKPSESQVHLHFDHLILAGNDLLKDGHLDHALKFYNKALNLNYDNDTAQAKINEVKFLMSK